MSQQSPAKATLPTLPAIDQLRLDATRVQAAKNKRFNTLQIGLFVGMGFIVVLGLAIAFVFFGAELTVFLFPILFSIAFIGIIILILIFTLVIKPTSIMQPFAAENGLLFQDFNQDLLQSAIGSIFTVGHSKSISDEVSFMFHTWPSRVYNYTYTTGYGSSSRTYYSFVVEAKLPVKLPQLVLDSKLNDKIGSSQTTLPVNFNNSQKIELEGDFNKYFDVYVPQNFAVEALKILSPDVMQTLIQTSTYCDVELVDDRLYLYFTSTLDSEKELIEALTAFEALHKELQPSFFHEVMAKKIKKLAKHTEPPAQVAGVRLRKQSVVRQVLVVVGVVVGISILAPLIARAFFQQYVQFAVPATYVLTTSIVLIIIIFHRIRQIRLRHSLKRDLITIN